MKLFYLSFISFCLLMLVSACKQHDAANGSTTTQQPDTINSSTDTKPQEPAIPISKNVGWEFESSEDESATVHTKITFVYDGVKYRAAEGIGHFQELPKADYEQPQYAVPKEALTATTGYWAGLQQTYYAAPENNFINIYRRTTDVEDTTGYDAVYEPVMKLDLKSTLKNK